MKNRLVKTYLLLAAAAVLIAQQPVQALVARTQVYPPSQVGVSRSIKIGTYTAASTSMHSLVASASYDVQCSDLRIGAMRGAQTFSDSGFVGPKQLLVTVPTSYPSTIPVPGWSQLPVWTLLNCVNHFSGYAREGTVTLGVGGNYTIGGEEYSLSGSLPFDVIRPGTPSLPGNESGCIP